MQEQPHAEGGNLDVNYREIDVLEREFQQVPWVANVDSEWPSRRSIVTEVQAGVRKVVQSIKAITREREDSLQ